MGYALVHSPCFGCGRVFSYNPHLVPSLPIAGVRQPICQACVDHVNPQRIRNGLAPIKPHPNAYEPIEESEL